MRILKKSIWVQIFILFLIAVSAEATEVNSKRVSVLDFTVQSANTSYKFLGKGFAEFVGIELSKSGIELVERKKMTELLKEQELSQSGLIDEDKQIEMGKMLAAQYVVTGDIFDIAGKLTVTFKVISTETAKIISQDKVDGKIESYDYISASISEKILTGLKLDVPKSIAQKIEKQEEKQAEAVVTFSNAIDAYDRDDMKMAKEELEKAKEIDPESEAVNIYLSKISTTSPKFKIQLETFSPTQNPASLGLLKQDKIYTIQSLTIPGPNNGIQSVGDGYGVAEMPIVSRIGVDIPLWEGLGINAEFVFSSVDNKIEVPQFFTYFGEPDHTYFHPMVLTIGGNIGAGYLLNENLSLGGGVAIYQIKTEHDLGPDQKISDTARTDFAFDLGFLVRTRDEKIIFDMHAAVSSQKEYLFDPLTLTAEEDGKVPILIESTLTTSFFNKRLFLVLKELTEIYTDKREGYAIRGIPVVEFWPVTFLSVRAGYEFAYINLFNHTLSGSGFMAGGTLRVSTFDIDFNYTQRYKPTRVLPGYGKDDTTILIGISKHATFFN
ncbi:MAG: CsgG/HfaB family protein [Spirochaetia bacterium]|nr:CsgG/HfaB family protein [Spirochaetia bacterium]